MKWVFVKLCVLRITGSYLLIVQMSNKKFLYTDFCTFHDSIKRIELQRD